MSKIGASHQTRGNWTLAKSVAFTYDDWNVIEERENNANGELTHHLRHTLGADVIGSLQGAGGVGGLVMSEEPTRGTEGRQTAAGCPAGVRTRVERPNQLDTTGNSNPPVPHYFWYDGNGNVTGIVDGAGSLEATYRYTSFGAMAESSTVTSFAQRNAMKFSTKYHDPEVEPIAGTYYYGYRHYLPSTGRWPSRDPIGEEGGVNLYGMAYNDILNSIEFLGLCAPPYCEDCEAELDRCMQAALENYQQRVDAAERIHKAVATEIDRQVQQCADDCPDSTIGIACRYFCRQSSTGAHVFNDLVRRDALAEARVGKVTEISVCRLDYLRCSANRAYEKLAENCEWVIK